MVKVQNYSGKPKRQMSIQPIVIGHRGAAGHAPENTLASFQKAAELGIAWVEFDVRLTQDAGVVVMHDASLKRTTGRRGTVKNLSLQQLIALDAGSWFAKEYSDQKIPSLIDTIKILVQLNLNANIELKAESEQDAKQLAKVVLAILKQYWPQNLAWPLISSFNQHALLSLFDETQRQGSNKLTVGLLLTKWQDKQAVFAAKINAKVIILSARTVTHKQVQAISARGLQVWCYTVNSSKRAKTLLRWGVGGVFSDYPDRIQAIIKIEENL